MVNKQLNIGIIGLGTVGSGVVETLEKKNNYFKRKYNLEINILGISAKNKNKKRAFNVKKYKWYNNPLDIIDIKNIHVIVELIGGSSGLAFKLANKTLREKKHLITANKALLAVHGEKLSELAKKNSVNICFEAAVAGAIPVVNVLENRLLSDDISNLYGILNGTCNFILSQMSEKKITFESALKNAQNAGFAEADPFDDISGNDAAYKLIILTNLVFSTNFKIKDVYLEGITKISNIDLEMGDKLGYTILLLGISNIKNKIIQLRVHPCLVSKNSLLAKVKNELNSVIIEGDMVGKTLLIGKGAGKKPTAASVISDIINFENYKQRKLEHKKEKKLSFKVANINKRKGKFYLRIGVLDKPGVLADITSFFKRQKISISNMFQLEKKISGYVQLIFVTHNILERQLTLTVKKIEKLDKVKTKVNVIRIENNI
tara:strand:- start:484 stop:1779 length:1296 start_codon:yes stop_codon:yes gene_type:complete